MLDDRPAIRRCVIALVLGAVTTTVVAIATTFRGASRIDQSTWTLSLLIYHDAGTRSQGAPPREERITVAEGFGCRLVRELVNIPGKADHYTYTWEYGWPFAAFETTLAESDAIVLWRTSEGRPALLVPYTPRPVGFVADTMIFGSVWAVPLAVVPSIRRASRRAAHRCERCGYDITGVQVCPECGARIRTRCEPGA